MREMVTQAEDAGLVARAQSRDEAAFASLAERYRGAACAIAYSYLGNSDDTQDAVQDAFVQAYLRLGQLREPERFGAWLRRITENVCARMLRRRSSMLSLELVGESAAPSEDPGARALERLAVRDALGKLSPKLRVTTALFCIDGYSQAEVAGILEVPVNTVRSRLSIAKKQLAKEILPMVKDVLDEAKRGVRILEYYGHVTQADLVEETGDEERDDFLYSLVNVLQIGMGGGLRAVYYDKVYGFEGFVPLYFLLRHTPDLEAFRKLWSLVTHLRFLAKDRFRIDPLYVGSAEPFFDAGNPGGSGPADGYPCHPLLRLALKQASVHLFGDEIRPGVALSPDDALRCDAVAICRNWIRQAHCRPNGTHPLEQEVPYPLADPAPEREDRGFGDFLRVSTRVLHLARALVLQQAGLVPLDPGEVADAYATHVGGPWAELVQSVSQARYGGVSKRERRRVWLDAVRRMTAFENWFLERVEG